jgi:hypothetical protein
MPASERSRLFSNKPMKHIIPFIIITFFTGCAISINTNHYASLSNEEKAYFKPYAKVGERPDTLVISEISGSQCKQLISENKYTLVHLWNPSCISNTYYSLKTYTDIENAFENKGLKVILVAVSYDLSNIQKTVKMSEFHNPVYIISNSEYGPKLGKAIDAFSEEITGKKIKRFSDLLFKGTNLHYTGFDINKEIINHTLSSEEN